MVALGDVSAALGGSNISHMEEPGNPCLQKWKEQVKIMTTRLTVVRRFRRTYSATSFQCDIGPGLTAASPQIISEAKDESSKINLSTGAHFGPNQDAPEFGFRALEKKHGEVFSFKTGDVFKDHWALSTTQIALTLLTRQILKEADLVRRIIVTVIGLNSREEGTTPTYNHVVWALLKGLTLLFWLSTFEMSVAYAEDDIEEGKLEGSNESVNLPYYVQTAAWTFVVVIFTIAVINFAGRNNRRSLVPAPTAAPLAGEPPAAAAAPFPAHPPAVAPPVVQAPAPIAIGAVNVGEVLDDNPVAAAAAPLPAHPPAAAPPAVPAPAPIAIGAVNVGEVLDDNPVAAAVAPLPVHPPAADPLGGEPPAAAAAPLPAPPPVVAPPAVPAPAPIAIGAVNVGEVLDDYPAAARRSILDFDILPRLED